MTTAKALPPVSAKIRSAEATGVRPKGSLAVERAPSPADLGRQLLDAGRPREAKEVLERALSTDANDAELLFLLGRAAFGLGNHAHAQEAFSRVIALEPADAEAHRWLARVLLRRGDVVGAMHALGRATRSSIPPQNDVDYDESALDSATDEDEQPTARWVLTKRTP
jgi:tetratricopeptide (TPR) repeat protein